MITEETMKKYFTDMDGKLKARLSHVLLARTSYDRSTQGVSSKYSCIVKIQYHKQLMAELEEGMLFAVENFRSKDDNRRFTLMEISRVYPEHYGLKGLSDSSFYPLQFEVIEQSRADWEFNDPNTMIIHAYCIPVNYELIIDSKGEISFKKGFVYPIVAEKAYIVNKEIIDHMYNDKVRQRMNWDIAKTTSHSEKDPRLGVIKMFEGQGEIPIYVDFDRLVRYHFGIFAFTGGGKSNLMSNLLRRLIKHTKDTKIVIFDISNEYVCLLLDLFSDPTISATVVLDEEVTNKEQFYTSFAKPRSLEDADWLKPTFDKVWEMKDRVRFLQPDEAGRPTYQSLIRDLELLRRDNAEKPTNLRAIQEVTDSLNHIILENKVSTNTAVSPQILLEFAEKALQIFQEYKVWNRSALFTWAETLPRVASRIEAAEEIPFDPRKITAKELLDLIEGETRLVCLSISDPVILKKLATELTYQALHRRKKQFKTSPQVLFVFDEAQEFIPNASSGINQDVSRAVEMLLRQGRKYGLGGCIATQRLAYLNTNALQQLHTYFVGTLPRPYDRGVVSEQFMIDIGILEKTLEFGPGEWLLSSYIATGIENVPIFIKADDSEKELERLISKRKSKAR